MLHPATELRRVSGDIGLGVFATELIPQGTVTWVRDDLDIEVSPGVAAALPPALRRALRHFAFVNPEGAQILCWDHARYMNHSCSPAVVPVGRLCDIAARDILPGEEVTCDYALHNVADLACRCDAANCAGTIRVADLPLRAALTDAVSRAAVALAPRVLQPLLGVARAADAVRLVRIVTGAEGVPSCLENVRALPEFPTAT